MEEDAVQLAAEFPQVPLFIAGGFRQPAQRGGGTWQRRLASGAWLFTTSGAGVAVLGCEAGLIPLDSSLAEDPLVAGRVVSQAARFALARSEVIGWASALIADTPQPVADLIRGHLGADVGVINLGTLRPQVLESAIFEADVAQWIRFDDAAVSTKVKGAELQPLAVSSMGRF